MDRLVAMIQAKLSGACENGDRDKIAHLLFRGGLLTPQAQVMVSIASRDGHLDVVKLLQQGGER